MLATSANTVTATWETVGGFQVIEAVVIVALFTRLIFYFRGSLKFGALVYLLFEVFADISAFVVLLLISFLTFAFSMRILVSSTSDNDNRVAGFPSLESAIFSAVNMGLYAQFEPLSIESNLFTAIAFESFMFMVQVVLLNLLIAIMSESHTRVRNVSLLVAKFERARLILEHENGMQAKLAQEERHRVMPRWLHVLQPDESREHLESENDAGDQVASLRKEMVAEISTLRQELSAGQRKLTDLFTFAFSAERDRNAKYDKESRYLLESVLGQVQGGGSDGINLFGNRMSSASAPKASDNTTSRTRLSSSQKAEVARAAATGSKFSMFEA